jgi:anthranilate phosphoribosyltransferase
MAYKKTILEQLIDGQDLSAAEMTQTMDAVMDGEMTPAQISALLIALRIKGETVAEISAAAASMRAHATPIAVGDLDVVDTCGTGGDGAHTINISTAAALVAAAAGVPIAKHGNRSVSSQCGSADVLAALGVNLDIDPDAVGRCVREVGIGFLFAPKLHGAMKHAIGPRRELGVRTIFNMLGPLTNPAGARRQVIGVFAAELTGVFAAVLRELGSTRAMIVHGNDGLDEISTTATTHVAELSADGTIREYELDPRPYIGNYAAPADLKGGDAEANAAALRDVFAGATGPQADIIALNAAAAIYVGGAAGSMDAGVERARGVLADGSAAARLEALVAATQA